MSVFQVIAHNLLGFDLIIFVAAALNGVCYYFARKNADRLYRKLHMIVFVPSRRNDPDSVSKAIRDVDEEQVVAMRKRSESLYSVFVNFAALTSTFWGLVFAILFKLLDGFLSARMEDNDKAVDLLLQRRELLTEDRDR